MSREQSQQPDREPDAIWSTNNLICRVWDDGERRFVHMQGWHHGQYGLESDTTFVTQSSLSWLADLFAIRKSGALKQLQRAEGPFFACRLAYYRRRFGVELAGKRVLELGCGSGASTINLLEQGLASLVAVDTNGLALRMAQRRIQDFNLAAPAVFLQIDESHSLPVTDQAFDVVVAFEVFEHVPPELRGRLIRELYGKVAPSGHLLISSPNRVSPRDLHITGLWLVNYLPLPVAIRFARLVSKQWRGVDAERIVHAGIVPFSWWQERYALKDTNAIDLASVMPVSNDVPPTVSRTGAAWNKLVRPLLAAVPRITLGWPADVFAAHLFIAYQRPV